MKVEGSVISGIEKGKYYVEKYNRHFEEKLGYSCFPGTLNVKTEGFSLPEKSILITHKDGFTDVKCFRVSINGVQGAVVVPQMPRKDKDTLEIISPHNLRESLNLKNGDRVTVSFE